LPVILGLVGAVAGFGVLSPILAPLGAAAGGAAGGVIGAGAGGITGALGGAAAGAVGGVELAGALVPKIPGITGEPDTRVSERAVAAGASERRRRGQTSNVRSGQASQAMSSSSSGASKLGGTS